MRILLTGASSFSGYWFAKELTNIGHEVIAPINGPLTSSKAMRNLRVRELKKICDVVEECPFGSPKFIELVKSIESLDCFSVHGAYTLNYNTSDFDEFAALTNNTLNIQPILEILRKKNCPQIVLTGTVFEQNEGNYPHTTNAVSKYGLAKTLTANYWQYFAAQYAIPLKRFIISNPFGPFEEPRFTSYLIKTWANKDKAVVKTPDYVRDNIPVDLLAKAYAQFLSQSFNNGETSVTRPSYYIKTQGAFAHMFAEEMRKRFALPCELSLGNQTEFPEPKIRVNSSPLNSDEFNWSENLFWDELANYYTEYVL